MTWPGILYLGSILLTCGLNAFLALYAWKHRRAPGSRAYAGLAFSEFLLALAEIISVCSPSIGQALFWFRVRYTTVAFIGVFWVIFALEYSGRKDWLSRPVRIGLMIIPLVTQALLWSNSLHNLWVSQEVAFHPLGPLWIADPVARIPGLGFLVHSFYNLLLLLVGITVMLRTAWKMRREFIGQALLLAGAGLTALVFALNSLFGLFPKTVFNLFTPGIGLSVLLIALAVFRFQFLKRAPTTGSALNLTDPQGPERHSLVLLGFVFLLLVSGITASAYASYTTYERQFRAQVERQLSAIADLKVGGLADWRRERLADAEVLRRSLVFATLVQGYLENPADTQIEWQLQTWLDSLREAYRYNRVFLLDVDGIERLASPQTPEPVAAHLAEDSAAALASGQVAFLDFHRNTAKNIVYLALLVPVYAEGDVNRPLGVVVMRIDPEISLYPYLSLWPASSESAETLLVRREGDGVLFLNPVRFDPGAALHLRFPLADTDVLAVKAALGQTGVVEGRDYRGEAVIGALAPVPGSPWLLVARMDTSEVYAPLRERLWQTILFYGALLAVSGSGLLLYWRQQRLRYYQAQVKILENLRASEEKFKLAFETSPDAVAITRLKDGQFVSANQGFEQILGYTADEVLGKSSLEIDIWEDLRDRQEIIAALQTKGKVENIEARFHTKDGETRYGLMSAAVIQLNGEPHIINITRDITERKQVEDKLIASEVRYRRLFEAARDGILILDADTGLIVDVNPFLVEMLGSPYEEICGKELWELGFFKDIAENKANFLELQQKEYIRYEDLPLETTDGRRFNVEFVSNVYQVDHRRVIQCNIRDITERRQAENMLQARLRLFEFAEGHSLEELLTQTLDEVCLLTDSPIGFYHFVDADEQALTLQAWSTRTKQAYCKAESQGLHYPITEAGVWVDCIHERKPVIHNDYASLPHRKGLPEGHAPLLRELVVPILRQGKVVAILGVGNKAQDYTPKDIEVVSYFADVAWEVAEHKRADAEIHQLNATLEQRIEERTHQLREAQEKLLRQERLATLGQLAGSIAHELRNPLGVISNAAYYLNLIQPQVEPRIQEYLMIIENETHTAEKIISDLLDHSRIKTPDRHPITVGDLVQRALQRYPLTAKIHLVLDFPTELPSLWVDPGQIVQVLGNLLTNAYQAMPDGGKLLISAHLLDEDQVAIAVADTGVGIAPENMPRLFEPLFTTKLKGIGLGLSLSKNLVEANGGRITVSSDFGQGSTFTIYLPVIKPIVVSSQNEGESRRPHSNL